MADLDAKVGAAARRRDWPRSGLEHAIVTLDAITDTSIADRSDILVAATADAVAATSGLLRRLRAVVPEIVDGPVAIDRQSWISTDRAAGQARSATAPNRETFVDAMAGRDLSPSTKPFWVGLYTSTDVLGDAGMWELYLDATQSTLFPKPWHVWAVPVRGDVRIRDIPTAAAWVEFVTTYPLPHDGLTYPDWRQAAKDYDGVHMGLHAIVATQGIQLSAGDSTIAAPYWGVESTFWLHWAFLSPELVRTRDENETTGT